ncbi:MAG TPA: class I SAM-dependent methyltransferase [Candidatus Sulfopaludibacter sp.]|jgi:SAM-dependent methyltransferase|nr:class I SAM-dependent methyltransferase [Candidatus Sulfopaludibacter sp.]
MLGQAMAAYDDFAWFYDRYWNEEFHALAFPILERIWLTRLPEHAAILDVCCGTGYLAGLLLDRGYAVTGIDQSPVMVGCARQNQPKGDFRVGDAVSFSLPEQFDAAVSTFDSLNHILAVKDLQAAFRNVAASLKRGGLFAFDILLEDAYQTNWGQAFALVRDDHVLTITGSGFDFRSRKARCTITMFRLLAGLWQRSDVTIYERCYTGKEVSAALEQAGFDEILCYDAGDLGMAGQLGEGRTFFVAEKAAR